MPDFRALATIHINRDRIVDATGDYDDNGNAVIRARVTEVRPGALFTSEDPAEIAYLTAAGAIGVPLTADEKYLYEKLGTMPAAPAV